MQQQADDDRSGATAIIHSPARFVVLVVLLPGLVAAINQVLFEMSRKSEAARASLYPSLVISTAVISWCVGRYLQPSWLRWIVFAWCLVLLDLLTFAACASGPLPSHWAFALVLAQTSLLILWAILSTVAWQWRLPCVLVAVPFLVYFGSSFTTGWSAHGWHLMMLMASSVVVVLCGGLRLFRFVLRRTDELPSNSNDRDADRLNQFGIKHLLVWATAMAPLLLMVRGLDFLVFMKVDAQVVFPAVVAALGIATLNMNAIWAVLGRGSLVVRLLTFVACSLLIGYGMSYYFGYLGRQIQTWRGGYMLYTLVRSDWITWLLLDATLFAALLLFVRANGYLLIRKNGVQGS